MGAAKTITVKPIASADANRLVSALHYSGTFVRNSQLHFGVFVDNRCGGVMQFGPSLDKRKLQGLVSGTGWNEFIELNRMAFGDSLPRNSESRAIAYALRFMRRQYPHLKWVVSFADATQCGDGTIYRASGFVLTGIRRNKSIWTLNGETFTDIAAKGVHKATGIINRVSVTKGKHIALTGASSMAPFIEAGAKPLPGFQLRYVYFLHPEERSNLTVPEIPFSRIRELGAAMYRGQRAGSIDVDATCHQQEEGGSTPTPALQPND